MNFMWQEFVMPRRACKETTNFTLQKPVAMPRRACKENMNFTWQKSGPTENRDGSFQFIIRVECLVLWGNMIQTIVAGSAEKALRFQSAGWMGKLSEKKLQTSEIGCRIAEHFFNILLMLLLYLCISSDFTTSTPDFRRQLNLSDIFSCTLPAYRRTLDQLWLNYNARIQIKYIFINLPTIFFRLWLLN